MKTLLPTSRSLRRSILPAVALLLLGSGALAGTDRGYLGVTLQDINRSMAKALQLEENTGVLVRDVVADGPAEKAGLEAGDVILAFAGEAITEDHDLIRAVRGTEPGETVQLAIQRDGERRTITVELGKSDTRRTMRFGLIGERAYLGVDLEDLNEQLGEYFGVPDGEGALVNSVRDDAPAAAAGLRAGDVIVAIGDEDIEDSSEVRAALADLEAGDEVEIAYIRKGDRRTAKATLGETPEDAFGFHVGRLGALERHLAPGVDLAFPEGFDRDIRVVVPEGSRTLRRVIRSDAQDDLDQLREELEQMKDELKELKQELKK